MMLTPLDIHNKEFKRSFRGYNEDEIDEFLEEIAKDYEVLYRENIDLKENVERLKSKVDNFERLENTLHSTLIVAQETAEEVKANANRESESLRSSANREAGDLRANAKKEAELIVKAAELEAKKMIDAAAENVRQKQNEYDELNKRGELFRAQMKAILLSQLDLIGYEAAQVKDKSEFEPKTAEIDEACADSGEIKNVEAVQ